VSTTSKPASEKQIAFLKTLAAERPSAASDLKPEGMTLSEASMWISYLKTLPREVFTGPKASHAKATEVGIYFDPAAKTVYRVRPSKSTGNLYAERLRPARTEGQKGTFEYVAGLLYKVDPAWLLTLEEARAVGREFGFCVRCGALLENPKSVEAGLGTYCIKVWRKEEAALASAAA
jgi:hypothetical protein